VFTGLLLGGVGSSARCGFKGNSLGGSNLPASAPASASNGASRGAARGYPYASAISGCGTGGGDLLKMVNIELLLPESEFGTVCWRRRRRHIHKSTMIAMRTTGMATPMPTFALVERPRSGVVSGVEDGAEVGDGVEA